MSPASRRLLRAAVVLLALLAGLAGLLSVPDPAPAAAPAPAPDLPAETPRFTATHRATAAFLEAGRSGAATGRGLFETDFFKPKPAPPPKPKPAPPATRDLVVFYRGLAAFPDGARVAYFSVEGRTVTLAPGDTLAGGWQLAAFDADTATLAKGDTRLDLPFNRRGAIAVPAQP